MIPQRVRLKGFLCYKEEQAIGFDGNATLWMLSGLNGSGKSAIFDAVTYALFGHHRGGGQHAHELINKDSDGLSVEFDFLLDNHAYRAKRTLKRDAKGGARGTQQMFRLHAGKGNGQGNWVAVEGTGQRREFDGWVAEHVGLNYDTFTSSVLLLQGKAEKLLDSKPEGRREVLASIVDLDRYERLHRGADDARKAGEAELKTLNSRLATLPAVTPLEVVEAQSHIADAEAERDRARAEVKRLEGLEFQAGEWRKFRERLAQAVERRARAQALLADAPGIEKAFARLRELREVLPHLEQVALDRGRLHEAEGKAKELHKHRQKLATELAVRDNALKQTRDKRAALQALIDTSAAGHREVGERLRQSSIRLEKLKQYDEHEARLNEVREGLARLPLDPSADLEKARAALAHLEELSGTVRLLERFQARRDELREAVAREQGAQKHLQEVETRGKQHAQDVKRLPPLAEEAGRAFGQASERAAEARALFQQARDGLRELSELGGSKVCRHCGQALTEGHVKEEKRRRAAAASAAEAAAKQTAEEQRVAREADERLRAELAAAQKAHLLAREEYTAAKAEGQQLRQEVGRLRDECSRAYAELPEPFRARVSPAPAADWTATAYPAAADLDAARAQAQGAGAARQQVRKAEQLEQQAAKLKAQESLTLETLRRLQAELPADREGVRREHHDLEVREKTLFKDLDASRKKLGEADAELDRLTGDRDRDQAALNKADTEIKGQELAQQNARGNIDRGRKLLPPAWHAQADEVGLQRLHQLKTEQKALEGEGTEERGRELQQARVNLDALRAHEAALEAEQERFPEEARQEPGALRARLEEARAQDHRRDEELARVRQQLARLEDYQAQRSQAEQECLALEKELASQRLLAELLGRDRLQLYLVRQAERQVVEYANAVLDRLSGGQLYLRLSGEANGEGSSAKALELEAYNRATGEKPINVAFLSGSQKFRVAVSLALGIGQYASRQHRPIESVIIDEGFGCLDSQGRQVMIQELQNLRSQMRCILLVSHQEDFAEAFADGYFFELENGATRVKRFQK